MSIVSYCRRPACTATPEETLRAAAQRMQKEGIGLLVVTQGERLAGVLSDRDVALHVAAGGRDASSARVAAAMSRSPVSVEASAPLAEALGLMRTHRLRRLPVVDAGGRVVGVMAADDLARLLSREIGGLGEVLTAQLPAGAARAVGREMPQSRAGREVPQAPLRAAEHYAGRVVAAPASSSVAAVARLMRDEAVGSVVLQDEDAKAVGLVTDRDLALRVVAGGLDPAKTAASAVMSAPLIAAAPEDPLEEIVERMRTASVRRIPVLRDGHAQGLVAFDDLLVAFGGELEQLGACVAGELRGEPLDSYAARLRRDLEEWVEGAAAGLLSLGDQTLRALGGELEQAVGRVLGPIRGVGGEQVELRVRDLMRRDVWTCIPEDTLAEAARIMWERDCGCVPVVASDGSRRVVGMVTDRDACMASYMSGRRLAEMRVREVMASGVHSCRERDRVAEACRVMRSARVRRLAVVDGAGRLRGMLSLADVARGAAALKAPAVVDPAEVAHTLEAICRSRREAQRRPA